MPANPLYDAVHPLSKGGQFYGCHSKPRPVLWTVIKTSPIYNGEYLYRHSTECKYDQSGPDKRCNGCPSQQSTKE